MKAWLKKYATLEELSKWSKIGARVAGLVVTLRDKPRGVDYLSLGITGLDTLLEIRTERRSHNRKQSYDYFSGPGWKIFPWGLASIIFKHLKGNREMKLAEDVDISDLKLYQGKLDAEEVFWASRGGPTDVPDALYFKADRAGEIDGAISNVIWTNFQTSNLLFSSSGLTEDSYAKEELQDTDFIQTLEARLRKFIAAGVPRGVLLTGAPGTGKSSVTKRLADSLNLRRLRIDVSTFDMPQQVDSTSVGNLLKLLRPEMVVVDDADRVEEYAQAELLLLLEQARVCAKVVFVTINSDKNLIDSKESYESPILRPGRLDDHFRMPRLDPQTVQTVSGEDEAELLDRLRGLPIAYVSEYAQRKAVLGRQEALQELESLERRAHKPSEAE